MNVQNDIIVAVATAITALATIIIAYFSYVSSRILKWEKVKDRRNRQPLLILVDEINGDHRNLYAENIGYGPAINIVRTIVKTGKVTAHITSNEPLPIRPLGQMQRTYCYCATLPPINSVPIIDDPDLQVLMEYDDIFGNHYQTNFKNREHLIGLIAQRTIPMKEVARV